MKDYRVFERYKIEEWEDDIEWLGARLDFLWTIRDYNPEKYMELKLNKEKNDMYSLSNDEIHRIASKLHYSVDGKQYRKQLKNKTIEEIYNVFENLSHMRKHNLLEFIKKNNCNLYEYINLIYGNSDGFYYLKHGV